MMMGVWEVFTVLIGYLWHVQIIYCSLCSCDCFTVEISEYEESGKGRRTSVSSELALLYSEDSCSLHVLFLA